VSSAIALRGGSTSLFREKGTADENKAGLDLAIERGWLALHESGTYVKNTPKGAELFA
jgi:hypothetical protein